MKNIAMDICGCNSICRGSLNALENESIKPSIKNLVKANLKRHLDFEAGMIIVLKKNPVWKEVL